GDTGFVLGATVVEQLRTFAGKVFRLGDHLARLQRSLQIAGIEPGIGIERFAEVAEELAARNHRLLDDGDDLGLCIFVTPGPYPSYPPDGASGPTVCLHTYPLPFHLWSDTYSKGQPLATVEVEQISPQTLPPELKCRSRMHYYLADRQAAATEPGARALLLDSQGMVTETSTANVLIYRQAEGLVSPPPEKILHGISLAELAALAAESHIPMVHREISPDEVAEADEVLLCSTPYCLLPATRLDGRRIGPGEPGPVFAGLLDSWSKRSGVDIAAQARRFSSRR
ncbi:MAG: aminotransferase class IV, partial [Thermoguttaceae bacterium]